MQPYAPYLKWIETQMDVLLARTKKWASINTYSFNVSGLSELSDILAKDFRVLGAEAERVQLPPQKRIGPDGSFYDQPLGAALRLRKRPGAPMQVLLGGHYDTVFAPSSSFQTVAEHQPGIWNGPGLADMKGGLAILLTAVEAFERSPFLQHLGWEILLTPDEEIGSPGSSALYVEAAKRHRVGLLFEPSFSDGAFVSERKGSATYTVVVRGRSAHVGRDFSHGRSAAFALCRFIHQLDLLQQRKEMTVNVADVEAKGPVNIVPPLATCRINIRSMHLNLLNETFAHLKQIAEEMQADGIQLEILQDTFRSPKPFDQQTQSLFEAYGSCASSLHLPFSYRSTGGVCDGNILAGAGLPTLDTAGAIGGALHTQEEFLTLSSLVDRSKLAALFLLKLANHEIAINQKAPHG